MTCYNTFSDDVVHDHLLINFTTTIYLTMNKVSFSYHHHHHHHVPEGYDVFPVP